MTWEEKFLAIKSLGEARLNMAAPGQWNVSQFSVDRVEDGLYCSGGHGGRTPEEAVVNYWEWLTSTDYPLRIITSGKEFKWTGFMWNEVEK